MAHDDERLERVARIMEASTAGGRTFADADLEAYRVTLGPDFALLQALVEVARILEVYMGPSDGICATRAPGTRRPV